MEAGPSTDEELVRLATQTQDPRAAERALDELLARYQRPIYLWCYRYVRERERALDLAQDVMAKLWESLPRFNFQSKFSWWVFVVTRNRCLNAIKEPRSTYAHEELSPQLPHFAPGVDRRFEQEESVATVRRLMLEHLDEQERSALALSHFEQLPVDEITRLLGLQNSTGARALLQRARRKLRTAVERHAGDEVIP